MNILLMFLQQTERIIIQLKSKHDHEGKKRKQKMVRLSERDS